MNAAPKVSYQNSTILIEIDQTFTFAHHHIIFALKRINVTQIIRIDIDFKNTLYIDSAGIGMLLMLKAFCQKNQLLFHLFNATRGNLPEMLSMIDLLPSVENIMSNKTDIALSTACI